MFSALKRLTGRNEGVAGGTPPLRHGGSSMSHNLQRKFARGVQYNMKIIIKGDRNVGKTCLFHRLKGEKFVEEYNPTNEIQVASIQWSYKATDDVVKVEVWDVVDRGNKKKKKSAEGLKLDNKAAAGNEVAEEPVLDAEFLDVYKGTNGVIMVMDITKSWTFDYIQRELPKVPEHIPVLVLANHCDMAHHRAVTSDHVVYFIESVQRSSLCAQIRYAESSMRNGFGLKFLHKFLNLPFLQLQRETLLAQLETNSNETKTTVNELDLFLAGPDADYNQFLQRLVDKRRQAADSVSAAQNFDNKFGPPGSAGGPVPSPNAAAVPNGEMRRSSSVPGPLGAGPQGSGHVVGAGHPIGSGHPIGVGHPHPVAIRQSIFAPAAFAGSAPPVAPATPTAPTAPTASSFSATKTDAIMSKLFKKTSEESRPSAPLGRNDSTDGTPSGATPCRATLSGATLSGATLSGATLSVEEFVPDGGVIDRSFLEDGNVSSPPQTTQSQQESDSEDDLGVNPLVAGFEDDLDSEDEVEPPVAPIVSATAPATTVHSPKNVLVNPNAVDNSTRKSSTSSVSSSGAKGATVDDETVLDGEVSTITGDALDVWLSRDSKWRRSPEGGEDSPEGSSPEACGPKASGPQSESSELRADSQSDHKKKSRHKDKVEEKGSTKKHKKKEKEKKKKKPSRKEERVQNELQEFLSGPATSPGDSFYEPL